MFIRQPRKSSSILSICVEILKLPMSIGLALDSFCFLLCPLCADAGWIWTFSTFQTVSLLTAVEHFNVVLMFDHQELTHTS